MINKLSLSLAYKLYRDGKIRENTYEGRYAPTLKDGSRPVHTVYAKTKEECEYLLREMIIEVNSKIANEKQTA